MAPTDDDQWSEWREQIKLLGEEVRGLVLCDLFFRESMRTLDSFESHRRNSIYEWLRSMYGRDVIVQSRRLLDKRRNTQSLVRLLQAIEKSPHVVNPERFVVDYPTGLQDAGRMEFNRLVRSTDGVLPKRLVRHDRERLLRAWQKSGMEAIANTRIIHNNPTEPVGPIPQWRSVHGFVRILHGITRRYEYLLLQRDARPFSQHVVAEVAERACTFWLGTGPRNSPPG